MFDGEFESDGKWVGCIDGINVGLREGYIEGTAEGFRVGINEIDG